ncbi:ATP-dependent Clp protease proteolytic subunit 4, chloroplastic-like isoform X1 [Arachis ipaensis]|uniref:ATP-dependent Clp protease proteolytic subunit 4, chloroplastic-like isoform X1 n=1 Tax=Arachis ipaensis TaxID=130454 RepID=UPI000A2B3E41|nr:ATP-dependent Clp protease proteolytic subunit 4, chloroplastic-like isoform X1 [Arachis ipaensis]XP_025646113.1 ATP-dependent Clp protease proteolytic subunit 4, chloroplastic isoform X1 [Arachis hypogaea]
MPATALRGAESDVMGMLLRERIVFLGSSIDDFVAEAVMSQLLLLDAQDPTKDIRLFINSPGGSLSVRLQFDRGIVEGSAWRHNCNVANLVFEDRPPLSFLFLFLSTVLH